MHWIASFSLVFFSLLSMNEYNWFFVEFRDVQYHTFISLKVWFSTAISKLSKQLQFSFPVSFGCSFYALSPFSMVDIIAGYIFLEFPPESTRIPRLHFYRIGFGKSLLHHPVILLTANSIKTLPYFIETTFIQSVIGNIGLSINVVTLATPAFDSSIDVNDKLILKASNSTTSKSHRQWWIAALKKILRNKTLFEILY